MALLLLVYYTTIKATWPPTLLHTNHNTVLKTPELFKLTVAFSKVNCIHTLQWSSLSATRATCSLRDQVSLPDASPIIESALINPI